MAHFSTKTHIVTIPGRLCLTGEHSDWAADFRPQNPSLPPGAALILALTSEYLTAEATSPSSSLPPSPSSQSSTAITFSSRLAGHLHLTSPKGALLTSRISTHPWRFASAVAYLMLTRFKNTAPGIILHLTHETIPAARGFSSSAAICVLVARAFNTVYSLNMTENAEMDIAYAGERMTGSACGRMDQIVAIGPGRVACMTFDSDFVDYDSIHIENVQSQIYIVVADLDRGKDTALILSSLQQAYPNTNSENAKKLRRFLGERNLWYVNQMKIALINGDAKTLGELMTNVQKEFDAAAIPFCERELTAPYLHATLADENVLPLVYGGKGVGSQGDGAVQFVARDKQCAHKLVRVLHQKLGTTPTIVSPGNEEMRLPNVSLPATNARSTKARSTITELNEDYKKIRTAVIPTAGDGTRLFPASRAVRPKGLLPIVDNDGFAKPILMHIIEQAILADIQHVIIIAAPGIQAEAVRSVISQPPQDLYDRLNPLMKKYADKIAELRHKVSISIQPSAEGFGHAVSCAFPNTMIGCEEQKWKPFVLLLGDVVYTKQGAVHEVIREFEKYDGKVSIVGVTAMKRKYAKSYGVVVTKRILQNDGISEEIMNMVEKPTDQGLDHLCRKDIYGSESVCDVILGPYALTGQVMGALKRNVELDLRDGGEIQLTSALVEVMGIQGMRAIRLPCDALDTGNAGEYVRTFTKMGAAFV